MMEKENISKDIQLNEELKKLVIARIKAQVSSNLKLSIGSSGSLDKEKMIEQVMAGSEVGRQIMDAHINFIKAQANGQLVTALNSV